MTTSDFTNDGRFGEISNSFESNVAAVFKLVDFDNFLLDFVVVSLHELSDDLAKRHKLGNASKAVHNRAMAFENVRRNESLRPVYHTIFNQCVVLLVSYFGSAVHDVFRTAARVVLVRRLDLPIMSEEIKLSWREFATGADAEDVFVELLISQRDISFQDMQSISRTFNKYFDVDIERNEIVNNIILGQASRHVIVHSGNVIDQKLLRQVSNALPRTLKQAMSPGELVSFSPDEIRELAASMSTYLAELSRQVMAALALPEDLS